MNIRRVEERDLEQVAAINNIWHYILGQETIDFFHSHMGIPYFSIVEDSKSIVGFVMVFDERSKYDNPNLNWFRERLGKTYYLDRVALVPKQTRVGLGKMLYEHLFDTMSGKPFTCEVDARIVHSNLFHQRMGFSEMGRFSPYGQECIMYKK